MIQTGIESRVKIQDIISNQLPEFVLEESPKALDFLKQYYISQEYQSGPTDIVENLDQYLKVDNLIPEIVVGVATLSSDINLPEIDDNGNELPTAVINVSSTKGFPNKYGLLKIDDEIITYTEKTSTSFINCVRGFSGITSYHQDLNDGELVFSSTNSSTHSAGSTVENLSSLFLREFYKKLKYTFIPGFEEKNFTPDLNVGNFIKEARSFYESKGTDESFRILFNVLFGETPKVINLEDRLLKSSDAEYIRREVVIAESISGNPLNLEGQTIFKTNDTSTNASVSEIEIFTRKGIEYYKISLFVGYSDSTSIQGTFTITPNTKSFDTVPVGSSVISVDSTIGFPKTGTIKSGNNVIKYSDKNINQFLGCEGVTSEINPTDNVFSLDETYFGYENGDTSKKVELRLTGVISDFNQKSKFVSVNEGQILTVKNIGDKIQNFGSGEPKTYKEVFANSWIYNASPSIEIESFIGDGVILKEGIDRSQLKKGDRIEIIDRSTNHVVYPISDDIPFVKEKINFGSNIVKIENFSFAGSDSLYSIRRKINKASSNSAEFRYGNDSIISDVQNLYSDNEFVFVASNSLPSSGIGHTDFKYNIQTPLNESILDFSSGSGFLTGYDSDGFTIISFDNPVNFITGDRIYYKPSLTEPLGGLEEGYYYVEVQSNPKEIKLYTAASSIGESSNVVKINTPLVEFDSHIFTIDSQSNRILNSQKLLKKFKLSPNISDGKGELTLPGSVGMLMNGVEIFNYKTNDIIYYGPIESVSVLNGGNGYDVVNPPIIEVSTGAGTTALVQPVVTGTITDIFVDKQDFDVENILSVSINGGNISGGKFEPVLVERRREILFDARSTTNGGGISTSTPQLTFLTDHNLNNGEEVFYNNLGNPNVSIGIGLSSLSNGSSYFVSVDNNTTIKLYDSYNNYLNNNPIGFAATSLSGTQKFLVGSPKKTISEIKVIDGGSLTNRKLLIKPSGISTTSNLINFQNHGFKNGEIIEYSYTDTIISGLSTAKQYYVLYNDENSFRLCDAGIGGTVRSNFEQENFVKIDSIGSGFQEFKYPEITANVEYTPVGVGSTVQSQIVTATPVVKGRIVDLYLYETGTGYGSSILNEQRKPRFTIKNGRDAQVEPIIVNGLITDTNLQFGGYEYFSTPTLEVRDPSGSGTGAKLRAIVSDSGEITDIKIVNPGIGYSTSSTINIIPSGSGVILDSNLRKLYVNNVNKTPLRQYETFENRGDDVQYFVSAYNENIRKTFDDNGNGASKIIGWAYDGNPIYGPFVPLVDSTGNNSGINTLTSSYQKDLSNIFDRPTGFDLGFFIDDYKFDDSGDLDVNNGRFSKTPDFPNGIYAYYATIDPDTKEPVFPYFIGKSYRSNTLKENNTLDQDFDFNSSSLIRNTYPHKISETFSDNDFVVESNEISRQKIVVESTSKGFISGFDIINSGDGYKVGDELLFDDENTNGGGLKAKISSIKGKDINQIETTIQSFPNSTFVWEGSKIRGYILPSHDLQNLDYVNVSGFSTSNISKLNGILQINVEPNPIIGLSTEIVGSGSTTTEIYLTHVPSNVSAGNSIGIGTEVLQVLNVYPNKNIIRVKRGLVGTAHTVGEPVIIKNNTFTIDIDQDYFESKLNEKIYFNPHESIGIGTISGVGYSTSFNFGNEIITRNIPTQRLYIEDHPFTTNQKITFNSNGGSSFSIATSPTGVPFNIPSTLYAVNKSPNTIGIKTGLGEEFNEVYFIDNGDNFDYYYFETNFEEKLGNIEKITSVVSVSTSHGLTSGDTINLSINPQLNVGIGTSTSIKVVYEPKIGTIIVNPIGFNSTGINTSTNELTILNHELKTGDRIFYNADVVCSGLSTGSYFVYKVTSDKIKLCDTFSNSNQNPPIVVSIGDSGGASQSISLINPQIQSIKNNNIVFDLTDPSLSGYKFKVYYDNQFKNEFISVGTTNVFNTSGVGTVGVSTNASFTIKYTNDIPEKLYYNLEKSGYISSSDTIVKNYSEILYINSYYDGNYKISDVGITTFKISLQKNPEKNSYTKSECEIFEYTTSSLSANGPVDKIKIFSSGSEYRKLPTLKGADSENGEGLNINVKSNNIGNIKDIRVINQGFEYSSDKTLQPQAFISPKIVLKDSNTIGIVTVIDGGSGFVVEPDIVVINKDTREVVDNGLLKPVLLAGSISNIKIEVPPKGISDASAELFTTNNTNGISIKQVKSSATGIFTCSITTPAGGFSINPFSIGDEVFIEGIQKFSADGDGFNSSDYGYRFFIVTGYNTSSADDEVEIGISSLTSNTGIAKTIQDSSGTITNRNFYPNFDITIEPSFFSVGETLRSNNIDRDLTVTDHDANTSLKVFGTYELSKDEKITGKSSGNIATIEDLNQYFGNFEVDFSSKRNEGWSNETGKLNEDHQVLPDNDYYQNLSYTVKSGKQWKDIRTPVNSLVHTSGLKNFSDTQIVSKSGLVGVGNTDQTTIIMDFIDEKRVDTINIFDFVKDIDTVNGTSRFLKLQSKKLTNYTEVGTNIVLRIDDISDQFSNFDSDPNPYLDIVELNMSESYLNYLIKVNDLNNTQIQLTNVTIVNDEISNESFILEKQSLVNVGAGFTAESGEQYGDFSVATDDFGTRYLRFEPKDPFNTEYDLKYIEKKFIAGTGVGTTSIGFIDITSSTKSVNSSTTGNVVGFSTSNVSSFYVNANIIQNTTNEMNFVELYVTHDGNNTNISEYYFGNDSISGLSFNRIGTGFTATISSNTCFLDYINDTSHDVTVNSRIISFGTPSGVGIGSTFRFLADNQPEESERSAIYQSIKYTTNSGLSTTVLSLDKNLFDSVNSLVEVSIGSTKSTHQVFLIQDGTDIYTQEYSILSIGSTIGIGTFGGEYVGSDNFELKFYPDSNFTGNIDILSFSECLYSYVDFDNQYNDLTFGTSTESVETSAYFAINGDRTNRKNFILRSNGTPIFAKTFNPSKNTVLNTSTGTFSIDDHYFSNGEELIYTFGSTFIGVGATPLLYDNGSFTAELPSQVFAVVGSANTNNFQISTTRYGAPVSFVSTGEGNSHQFAMAKKNEKSLITIDNIAQYPLTFTKINQLLDGNGGGISATSNVFSLSGISTVNPLDILRIDDEYMNIINVGLGTTNVGPITNSGTEKLVEVERGFVGSAATSHVDGTNTRIYKGSFNIVGDEIFFTKAPRGNPTIVRDKNNLVLEASDFTGRVFLRSNYDTNQVYDDISDSFSGIGRTFTLTVGGANTTGIGSTGGNGIVFINGIFQTPTTVNNPNNNFQILENTVSGISSIVFSGIRTDTDDPNSILIVENDINQNQVPRGGIIISIGSSGGLGFAPLVGAAVTAVISGGVIQNSIGIGTTDNNGSGYNNIVSIGVTAYDPTGVGTDAVINATVGAGGTLSFNVINGGTGYSNQTKIYVSEPSYENLEVVGVSRLGIGATTDTGVGLLLNLEVGASSSAGIGSTYFEVTNFSITRNGYSFRKGDVFKPVGLVTDGRLGSPFSEFELTVLETFSDNFGAWQFGELDFIDSLKNYQDGSRVDFPLFYNGSLLSFELNDEDTETELQNSLIIFINGVLQDPGLSYEFNGGTSFTFTTPPKPEDEIAVFFYRGTRGLDDILVTNIQPSLEKGDIVQVYKNNTIDTTITQDKRTVFDLSFSDKFETNLYTNQGIDISNNKPMSWTKQKTDRIINGEFVHKTRRSLISQIYPTSRIIDSFSTSDTEIFVDDGDLFEYDTAEPFSAIIVDGKEISAGKITASIGVGGTVSSLTIVESGSGYQPGSTIDIKFIAPLTIGIGVGTTASATVSVDGSGSLTTPLITNPGFGYTTEPLTIVPLPESDIETVSSVSSVKGFSGIITGIESANNGGQLALKFYLKTSGLFDNGTNSLLVGYPIFVKNTTVGSGCNSVDSSDSDIVGIGTTFFDNIYYVHQISNDGGVNGIATCNVSNSTIVSSLPAIGSNFGQFSWGRLGITQRSSSPISIAVTGKTVDVGLSTFPTIQRRSQGLRQSGALVEKLQ